MLVRMVTRSVSKGSCCDEYLAYTSGYQKHGPVPKGGAVQLVTCQPSLDAVCHWAHINS
ncbi:hypothetical protein Fuma_03233 [Fuerstiella marisgermanici]|uniref:Uncharacterized protein n=1 Tax=Fuerstiella marisgermanici TaxID=1891926 RepID=A0A1P8WHS9_9PLAN|nr:hypothetical protein Fuma_03233 [Fuerstiella marisgermanici]